MPEVERKSAPYAGPQQLTALWEDFLSINSWRGFDRTNNLPNLLSLDVIADWAAITETDIGQFELDVFMRLEGAYWESMIPKQEKSSLFSDMKEIAKSEKTMTTVKMKPKAK